MYMDAKHVVLYAIYAEYQNDIPHMEMLSGQRLGMPEGIFNIALLKLQNEGLIDGLIIHPSHLWWSPKEIIMLNLHLTRAGLDYVERQAGIENELCEREKRNALYVYALRQFDFSFSEHVKYKWPLMAWVSEAALGGHPDMFRKAPDAFSKEDGGESLGNGPQRKRC